MCMLRTGRSIPAQPWAQSRGVWSAARKSSHISSAALARQLGWLLLFCLASLHVDQELGMAKELAWLLMSCCKKLIQFPILSKSVLMSAERKKKSQRHLGQYMCSLSLARQSHWLGEVAGNTPCRVWSMSLGHVVMFTSESMNFDVALVGRRSYH